VLPLGLFGVRVIAVGAAMRVLVGVVLFGQPAFVPPFLQGAMAVPPTLAGFILSGTAVGWAITANASGRAVLRWGYRPTGLVGAALLCLGFGLLRLLSPAAPLGWAAVIQGVIGLGFGAVATVSFLSMQNAVEWGQRGVATSTGHLALTVGGTLGVSLAGALFGLSLASAAGLEPTDLLSADRRAALTPAQLADTRALLVAALAPIYTLVVAASAAGVAIMALLPPATRAQPRSTWTQ
jgi:MFS family permease